MEFREAIMQRYATKRFAQQSIPDDLIDQLLEMVRWAPSGLNIQPWRIKIVTDPGVLVGHTCAVGARFGGGAICKQSSK